MSVVSYKFNEIIPLDKWKTAILTRIKGFIPDPEAPAGAKTVDSDGELWLVLAWFAINKLEVLLDVELLWLYSDTQW